ncbi:MAG TPA: class I SAM-dependent methyltransferase [Candidatus Dormibacteraeota bacterium]|nr:class I SAM-dependent methyltransferase [Candidatus Dormibacteraeota bacterium]
MNEWQRAYDSRQFYINTANPSVVVRAIEPGLLPESRVADLGCGGGRNAIHLAGLGHKVDAVDLADLSWVSAITDPEVKSRINFVKSDVSDFELKSDSYHAILMTRLIQYLDKSLLQKLLAKSFKALKPGGVLVIGYTAGGGVHKMSEYIFDKYSYKSEDIRKMLTNIGFVIRSFKKGSAVSKYVPHIVKIEAYDIIAEKL